jgi:hypothetical protein
LDGLINGLEQAKNLICGLQTLAGCAGNCLIPQSVTDLLGIANGVLEEEEQLETLFNMATIPVDQVRVVESQVAIFETQALALPNSLGFPSQPPSLSLLGVDSSSALQICGVTSLDPNSKVGPSGVGPLKHVSGVAPLEYSIFFDNQPTATAPAQAVTVTDTLDSNLGLTLLTLGPITFTNQIVTPPSIPLSVAPFTTTVDLRPTTNMLVKITASLNTATSTLTWTFQSLDPATNQSPTDPFAGFLPPGAEGSVFFTVLPKSTVTTGTVINNAATVVFDVNPPINTPTWSNTIDNTPPTSHVSALASSQSSPSFTVSWTGNDVGAGVQDFTIYVSDNGSSFVPWLTNTTATQATYVGFAGHTYSFYSIARDLVGNVETAKTMAEATTTVSASVCATDVTAQFKITPSGFRFNNGTQQFVQTVTLQQLTLTPIQLPLTLVLSKLSSNATLANKTGNTTCAAPIGSPYINLPTGSTSVTLQFNDPTQGSITYTPLVLMGTGTR